MEFLKNLKGKDIAMITTSVGGIILAGLLAWMLWKITGNHITHSSQAILQQAISNERMSGSLDKLTAVLDKKLR